MAVISDEVELLLDEEEPYVSNTVHNTRPLVIHGNGPSKTALNSLGNYIARSWSTSKGCLSCDENTYSLENINKVTIRGFPTMKQPSILNSP